MPKERGGEVTLKQKENRCICVDVGKGNICTIKNLRMLLKGPNLDANIESFQTNMDFEKRGNTNCIKEFFTHMPDKMYSIILVKSGTLFLKDCQLSLDGIFRETYRKVPCITVLEGNYINMSNCRLKGDTMNDANTAGLVAIDADVLVE